ncbi:hypothetical protein HPP92_007198 [Vanilla planifolia]|uniref:Uncharacterized protein n=1 Tax=Vanilla planifolia TaxID=51239 RepID=A0A835RLX2_VANPL|nr:hypothetical protein HPP92_007198 [Vanilla planifolia]
MNCIDIFARSFSRCCWASSLVSPRASSSSSLTRAAFDYPLTVDVYVICRLKAASRIQRIAKFPLIPGPLMSAHYLRRRGLKNGRSFSETTKTASPGMELYRNARPIPRGGLDSLAQSTCEMAAPPWKTIWTGPSFTGPSFPPFFRMYKNL